MSLNALSEWITASYIRKQTILVEQKNPRVFQTGYRVEAEAAIMECLASGGKDLSPLDAGFLKLNRLKPQDDWDRGRQEAGLETIESFRRCVRDKTLDLRGLQMASGNYRPMMVEGVAVSVRPEAFIHEGGAIVGGVKVFLAKSSRLDEARARYAGALLHQYVEHIGGSPDYRKCFIVDVTRGVVSTASRTFAQKRQELAIACTHIRLIWPTIPVKADQPAEASRK